MQIFFSENFIFRPEKKWTTHHVILSADQTTRPVYYVKGSMDYVAVQLDNVKRFSDNVAGLLFKSSTKTDNVTGSMGIVTLSMSIVTGSRYKSKQLTGKTVPMGKKGKRPEKKEACLFASA